MTWKILKTKYPFLNTVNSSLANFELEKPHLIPDLRNGEALYIGSDYGGEHKGSHYKTISFVMASNIEQWEAARQQFRLNTVLNGRAMEFKKLNDKVRLAVLVPFLNAANYLEGVCVTVAVDNTIDSLFRAEMWDMSSIPTEELGLKNIRPFTFEKMLRVTGLIMLFVLSMGRSNQDIVWFTDEDEIVANKEWAEGLLRNIIHHFLASANFDYQGQVRFGIAKAVPWLMQVEDFVSIADLFAGAVAEWLSVGYTDFKYADFKHLPNQADKLTPKTQRIIDWFNQANTPLKKLLCIVTRGKSDSQIRIKWLLGESALQ